MHASPSIFLPLTQCPLESAISAGARRRPRGGRAAAASADRLGVGQRGRAEGERSFHTRLTPLRLTFLFYSLPQVTLVGKGVCFDTGGLDIKPPAAMLTMKKDMGGAAHVLGLASMIMDRSASLTLSRLLRLLLSPSPTSSISFSHLVSPPPSASLAFSHLLRMIMDSNLPVRLRVLIAAVENSISGDAFRPGDVLVARNGKTTEIGNTDAEGRLVLADALVEVKHSTLLLPLLLRNHPSPIPLLHTL